MHFNRSVVATLTLVSLSLPLHAQTKRALALSDWYKLTTLSAPAMSPDGSRIAFQVQTVNEKDNKYHREIWVVPTVGGEPQRFTSPSTESSNPRWSPDGRYLIFTSQRTGGKGNTWMLRMDQPGGEAFQNEKYPRTGTTRVICVSPCGATPTRRRLTARRSPMIRLRRCSRWRVLPSAR